MYIYIIICASTQRLYSVWHINILQTPSNESFTVSDDLAPLVKSVADPMINSNVDLGCSNNDNNSSNYGGNWWGRQTLGNDHHILRWWLRCSITSSAWYSGSITILRRGNIILSFQISERDLRMEKAFKLESFNKPISVSGWCIFSNWS